MGPGLLQSSGPAHIHIVDFNALQRKGLAGNINHVAFADRAGDAVVRAPGVSGQYNVLGQRLLFICVRIGQHRHWPKEAAKQTDKQKENRVPGVHGVWPL